MVNLKTKFDKHADDNEKRRKSIKEKEKAKLNQSLTIKQALSSTTLSNNSNKKIIFNDDDENESNLVVEKSSRKNLKRKPVLFDSSDDEIENFEIKEKFQFDGEKDFELLNLQSTYGNDERFKIDERFLENEKEDFCEENNERTNNKGEAAREKCEQLKVLESVLRKSVVGSKKEKKEKNRINEMVRYDATNKDHEIYEINTKFNTGKPTSQKKRREERKKAKTDKEELPKVSKDKFYNITSEIKNLFKEKKEDGQFSILQTYGFNGVKENEENKEELEKQEDSFSDYVGEDKKNSESRKECKKAEEELRIENEAVVYEPKIQKKGAIARGIWKESFFLDQNDLRFKEGLEFINKKNSEEARDARENYDRSRKKLKEILRLHLKKHIHKKDPFKNKIGGMNKKQLASSRTKNFKINFNKKKPKRSLGRRT